MTNNAEDGDFSEEQEDDEADVTEDKSARDENLDSGGANKNSILHVLSIHNFVAYCDSKIKDKDILAMKKHRKYCLKIVEVHEREMHNHVISEASNVITDVNFIESVYESKLIVQYRKLYNLLK